MDAGTLVGTCTGQVSDVVWDGSTLYALCGGTWSGEPVHADLFVGNAGGALGLALYSVKVLRFDGTSALVFDWSVCDAGNNQHGIQRITSTGTWKELVTPVQPSGGALLLSPSQFFFAGITAADGVWSFATKAGCPIDACSPTSCAVKLGFMHGAPLGLAVSGAHLFVYSCGGNKAVVDAIPLDGSQLDAGKPIPIFEAATECQTPPGPHGICVLGGTLYFGFGDELRRCPVSPASCVLQQPAAVESAPVRFVQTDGTSVYWASANSVRKLAGSPVTLAAGPDPVTSIFVGSTHVYWGTSAGEIRRVSK